MESHEEKVFKAMREVCLVNSPLSFIRFYNQNLSKIDSRKRGQTKNVGKSRGNSTP